MARDLGKNQQQNQIYFCVGWSNPSICQIIGNRWSRTWMSGLFVQALSVRVSAAFTWRRYRGLWMLSFLNAANRSANTNFLKKYTLIALTQFSEVSTSPFSLPNKGFKGLQRWHKFPLMPLKRKSGKNWTQCQKAPPYLFFFSWRVKILHIL